MFYSEIPTPPKVLFDWRLQDINYQHMSDFTIPIVTSCNTCKASFSSTELIREHYRTEWHILNSKRRANNLAHLSVEEFKRLPSSSIQRKPSAQSSAKFSRKDTSEILAPEHTNVGTSNAKSVSFVDSKISAPEVEHKVNDSSSESQKKQSDSVKMMAINMGVSAERAEVVADMIDAENDNDDNNNDDNMDDNEPHMELSSNACIFDDTVHSSTEDCLRYMEVTYGFFIPDREYMMDLSGFIEYLNEKVKVGGVCLYCQKQLFPGWPCQNHMKSKSHCKIAYEEGIDEEEYEQFYDFSASYENGEGDENDDEGEDLVDETLEIAKNGELILTDGRIVGHRSYRKYYKQKYRSDDNRESTRAQKREEILRLKSHFGGIEIESFALQKMSDTELMILLMKKQKYIRKMEQISQRTQQKVEMISQRREFMNTKDRLRSGVNKTDIIRDYHHILM